MAREMASQGNGTFEFTARHHHNNDVKTRFVDALFRNDWDAIAPLVHPDFELREPAALAYGGIYKGIDGFRECWELIPKVGHRTEHLTTVRNHFAEDPDSMVVELETSGVHNETGQKFTSKVMEQFEFKEGLVSAIVLYWFDIP
jgi:ketosteroid isomerase-like protein